MPPLGFKTLAEWRTIEACAELRNDPTANVDATARAERQREIAGNGAQHGAKSGYRRHAATITAFERALCNLRRYDGLVREAVNLGDSPMQDFHADAGHEPLPR